MWRSDGTEAGTTLVKRFPNTGVFPLINVNGTLYFGSFGGFYSDLWRSDGTEAGTTLVKSHFVGNFEFADFRGTLYFSADDGVHGSALWRSDGTEAGTTMVKDFGLGSSLYLQLTSADTLYFTVNPSHRLGPVPNELWRSDGTEAGTTLVKQDQGGIGPIVTKGKALYFGGGGGLWRSDGTPQGTTLVKRSLPGGSLGGSLTAAKDTLYFVGTDKRHGQELWRSDGTRAGTTIVRDIRRGSATSDPGNLTAVGQTLFFSAKDGRHGRELWRAGPKPCTTAKGKCKKG